MGANRNVPTLDSSELKELTEKLITACHILDHEGVTDGYGHISVRVPGIDAFITIANVSPGCVTMDRLIMQDFDGNYLGGAKTPPNEWPIHACILKARPDVEERPRTPTRSGARFSACYLSSSSPCTTMEVSLRRWPSRVSGHQLVRTVERGKELAAALGDGPVVLTRSRRFGGRS